MLYYFTKGKNATETQKQTWLFFFGEGAESDRMCQKWFAKFLGTSDILTK